MTFVLLWGMHRVAGKAHFLSLGSIYCPRLSLSILLAATVSSNDCNCQEAFRHWSLEFFDTLFQGEEDVGLLFTLEGGLFLLHYHCKFHHCIQLHHHQHRHHFHRHHDDECDGKQGALPVLTSPISGSPPPTVRTPSATYLGLNLSWRRIFLHRDMAEKCNLDFLTNNFIFISSWN